MLIIITELSKCLLFQALSRADNSLAQNIATHALLTAGKYAVLISTSPVHSTSFSLISFKYKVTCEMYKERNFYC